MAPGEGAGSEAASFTGGGCSEATTPSPWFVSCVCCSCCLFLHASSRLRFLSAAAAEAEAEAEAAQSFMYWDRASLLLRSFAS